MEASMAATAESETLVGQIAFNLRFEILFTLCTVVFWVVTASISRGKKSSLPCKVVADFDAPKARVGAARRQFPSQVSSKEAAIIKLSASPEDVLRSYEAARDGDVLSTLSSDAVSRVFMRVFSAAVQCGRASKLPQYVKDSIKIGLEVSPHQLESICKMCTAKKNYWEALAAFDASGIDPANAEAGSGPTWSCLLFCAVEVKAFDRCHMFYRSLQKMRDPASLNSEDFVNMVRSTVHTRNSALLSQILQEVHESSSSLDSMTYNRGLAVCVSQGQLGMAETLLSEMQRHKDVCDVITYNTLLKGYSQAGEIDKCFALQEHMTSSQVMPSEITFGILLNACLGANLPDRAAKVFKDFQGSGCKLNAVLYTTLIKGLAQAGQIDEAMHVFEQMCASDVTPDLVAFSVLMKVVCDAGQVEVALQLFDQLLRQGLKPDEIVFNNLLSGCAERKNSTLGNRIFSDMRRHNIAPSHVTMSIMIKLFVKCREWDAALDLLNTSQEKHGLAHESRLYMQLASSCVRDRQGGRVSVVFEALLCHCSPDEAATSRLLQQCATFNMFGTAIEILQVILKHGRKVRARDANAVLAVAVKKRKTQIVSAVIKVMEEAGVPVDAQLGDNKA